MTKEVGYVAKSMDVTVRALAIQCLSLNYPLHSLSSVGWFPSSHVKYMKDGQVRTRGPVSSAVTVIACADDLFGHQRKGRDWRWRWRGYRYGVYSYWLGGGGGQCVVCCASAQLRLICGDIRCCETTLQSWKDRYILSMDSSGNCLTMNSARVCQGCRRHGPQTWVHRIG